MRSTHFLMLGFVFHFVVGCGGAPTSEPVANIGSVAAATQGSAAPNQAADELPGFVAQRPSKSYDDPRDAVVDFLQAVRFGKNDVATALLTTEAQREAWRNAQAITADGFPDAEFEVSEVAYLNDNTESHVLAKWSDVTSEGEAKDFQCVWLLNKEPHGWCVRGFAAKFLEGVRPVELNFENQAQMRKRQLWAEQQIRRHTLAQQATENAPVQQANRPTPAQVR